MPRFGFRRLVGLVYSLRGGMMLLVAAAILPAALLAVFIVQQAERQQGLAVRDEALRLALLVAHRQDEVIGGARRLLEILATLPSGAGDDPGACRRLFGTLVEEDSIYRNFAVIGSDGRVLCSAEPLAAGDDGGLWLETLRAGRGFALGEHAAAGPGGEPVLPAVLPLADEEGRGPRALVALLALDTFRRFLDEIVIPPETSIAVTDRAGIVLVAAPAAAGLEGRPFPLREPTERVLASRAEVIERVDPAGVPQLFAIAELAESGLRAIVATPRPSALASLLGAEMWPLAWLAVAQIVILIVIAMAARRQVLRPIELLAAAATRIAEGELSARSGLAPQGRDELSRLARVFDRMADHQQHRQEALEVRGVRAESRLRAALWASDTGTFHWDLRSDIIDYDHNLARLFGLTANDRADSLEDFARRIHPDDREGVLAAMRRCASEGVDFDSEFRVVWPDGSVRWLDDKGKTFTDADGRPVSLTGACSDITQRKRYEEQQRLLVSELNHRVKNMLATVQSIMVQTQQRSEDLESFGDAFNGRLGALARAHDLLTQSKWESAELRELVEQAVLPYGASSGPHVYLDGVQVLLRPKAALTLSMVLHELATNAVKYGALSNAGGRVDVAWRLEPGTEGRRLRLQWIEAGGPPVRAPARRGFGLHLIERSIAYDLAGEARVAYAEDGLRCSMTLPWQDNLLPAPHDPVLTAG